MPSTMVLLGHANWWLPEWLDRILPRFEIEGEAGPPPVEVAEPVPTTELTVSGAPERDLVYVDTDCVGSRGTSPACPAPSRVAMSPPRGHSSTPTARRSSGSSRCASSYGRRSRAAGWPSELRGAWALVVEVNAGAVGGRDGVTLGDQVLVTAGVTRSLSPSPYWDALS